jgi:hypothetical protein
MKDFIIPLLLFFSLAPIVLGFVLWIYGRKKKNKKLRHNGFMMMMLSLLIVFIFVFTIGATIFYIYIISKK